MLRVPKRFLNEVLWPEFKGLDEVLRKYLDDMTAKIISEAIFKGSTEEEVRREQPLIGSDVKEKEVAKTKADASVKPNVPTPPTPTAPSTAFREPPVSPPVRKVPRNAPCPCGSGRRYKKCCGKR
jgi:uncharacterized protein YecA (UPF0149 family)